MEHQGAKGRPCKSACARRSEASRLGSQIAACDPDQGFGISLPKEGGLLYFHRNSVSPGIRPSLPLPLRAATKCIQEDIGDTYPSSRPMCGEGEAGQAALAAA